MDLCLHKGADRVNVRTEVEEFSIDNDNDKDQLVDPGSSSLCPPDINFPESSESRISQEKKLCRKVTVKRSKSSSISENSQKIIDTSLQEFRMRGEELSRIQTTIAMNNEKLDNIVTKLGKLEC